MAKASVRGLEMYYEVHGDGPPLVMIMGLMANADWWGDSVKELARDYKVLAFDNRDAGRTTGPETSYSLKDMADDTVGLMNHVGIEKAHVLGASMGGMIAQELALAYPERVNRLVLACTTPGASLGVPAAPEVLAELVADRSTLAPEELAKRLVRVLLSPEWVEANKAVLDEHIATLLRHPISAAGYQRQLMAIMQFDAGPRLGEITAPTLVLHGTKDILVPFENGRILAERIPGARLEAFEGAAHGFTTEQPEKFVSVVREFLAEAAAA